MKLELATPDDCTRAVIGDLNARGQIQGQDMCDNASVVTAMCRS